MDKPPKPQRKPITRPVHSRHWNRKTPAVEALPGSIAYGVRYLRPAGTDYATRRNS